VKEATRRVGLSLPWLDEREEELVGEVLHSGRLSLGPTIERFEEAFAEAVGAPYAAAVSSGTAGLHLLCVAAGVGPGDEVVTSPYSFVASANCAIYEGATPVFADVDPVTLNLDPRAVEAALSDRTKAVVAVDIYGYPCELDELREICERRGIALIQDACEALGARYRGEPVGSHGPPAVFAFYPNKQITTGEGGMVTVHSEDEQRLLASLRNQGRADGGGWLEHSRLGFNYRLDDVRAAIGLGQLEKLDLILAGRAAVAARYGELLAEIPGLGLPCPDDEHLPGRRAPRALLVRLRRRAPGGKRPRGDRRRARVPRGPDRPLPAVHPPPAVHARALRLPRGTVSRRRGGERAHPRAPLPHEARRGGPGVRGRRPPGGARRVVRRAASQGEALAVWGLVAADVLAILVVYSVLGTDELYNVSGEGLEGGLSRALVQLSFPSVAGVAIALSLLALDALPRRAWLVGAPALALLAVFALPGVVDTGDLDARPVNAVPALGVGLALGLTVAAARRAGAGFAPRRSGDGWRLVAAIVVLVASLPWLTAELGFHLPGGIFLTDELYAEPGEQPTAAVHLGHHHGLMGALLVLSALLLSRPRLASGALRRVYAVLVSLMLVYGGVNLAQDLWHEQLVKRDWTSWDLPSALVPRAAPIWALMALATAAVFALRFARPPAAAPSGDNPA
jgi:perosamine synthetase